MAESRPLIQINEAEQAQRFNKYDCDGNGELSANEFYDAVM